MQEKDVLEEVTKELNWKGKIVVKIFAKTFLKVYNIGKINYFMYIKNKVLG